MDSGGGDRGSAANNDSGVGTVTTRDLIGNEREIPIGKVDGRSSQVCRRFELEGDARIQHQGQGCGGRLCRIAHGNRCEFHTR